MENDIQRKLGERIRNLRKVRGFSQEVFAERIGIATKTLSSIETGKAFMTSQTLQNILDVLGICANDLFSFPEEISKDDMYKYIINKLDFIKNDEERMKIFYSMAKGMC